MRLAIVGDTHYCNRRYHGEALAGRSRSPTAQVDVTRHVWTTEHVLPRLVEQLRAARLDVVLQLGDDNQVHCDDDAGDVAELDQALDFFSQIGRPLLFARGTHEGRAGTPADVAYRARYLPEIARSLALLGEAAWPSAEGGVRGAPDTSYALRAAGLRLIVLDYTTFRAGDAADQLLTAELAEAAARGERIFVCGHPPLVPVARPFFSRPEYARTVLERIAQAPAPIDAYFCGHTHNQVASLHAVQANNTGDRRGRSAAWLPQLQGAPVGYPDQPPIALEDVRPLLPPAGAFRYGWGFLEDSHPGWFLVDVDSDGVRARWQLVGAEGDHGEVRWQRAGEPTVVGGPPAPERPELPAFPPRRPDVASVRLRAAGMGSRAPHVVRLNGHAIGTLPVLEYFDARQGLAIDERVWSAIGAENELEIEPAAQEERCLGGFVLEVTLADGRVARSTPAPPLYATADKWDEWRWCTPGLVRVGVSETIRIPLHFMARTNRAA